MGRRCGGAGGARGSPSARLPMESSISVSSGRIRCRSSSSTGEGYGCRWSRLPQTAASVPGASGRTGSLPLTGLGRAEASSAALSARRRAARLRARSDPTREAGCARRARTMALRAPTRPKMPFLASCMMSISSTRAVRREYEQAARNRFVKALALKFFEIIRERTSPRASRYALRNIHHCCPMDRMLLHSQ